MKHFHQGLTYLLVQVQLFFFCIIGKLLLSDSNAEIIHNLFAILGCVDLAIMCWFYSRHKMSVLLPLFCVCLGAFLLAQNILYAVGYIPQVATSSIFTAFSLNELANGVIYTDMILILFHLGTILPGKRYSNLTHSDHSAIQERKYVLEAAKLSSCVLAIPAGYYLFQLTLLAVNMGYDAMLASEFSQTTLAMICRYCLSGLGFSLFGVFISTTNQFTKRMIDVYFVIISIYYFMLGERTMPISYLMVLYTMHVDERQEEKRFSIKSLLAVIAGGLIVALAAIIQKARNQGGFITVSMIVDSISLFEGGIIQTILEALSIVGYSASCLLYTMRFVPALETFTYGTTYLFGLTTFLPNLFGVFGAKSLGRYSLSKWLMEYLNIDYGPGFSMSAEAYLNFGWLGPIIMIFFGKAFKMLTNYHPDHYFKRTIIYAIFSVIFTLPRRYFGSAVSEIVIGLLPFLIMHWIARHRIGKTTK